MTINNLMRFAFIMNLKRNIPVALTAFLLVFSEPSFSEKFQIKGVSLGVPATSACRGSKITDNLGDIIRENKAAAPSLIEMGTTECEMRYPSFGGNRLTEPVKLLFLNDSLILFKLELGGLPLSNFVDIFKAFVRDYGQPNRKKSGPFVTDTWKQNGETLILERLGRQWDDNDVTIILRNETAYLTFQSRFDTNSALLNNLKANKTRNDMR